MRDFYDYYNPTMIKPGAFVQMPERVSIMDTMAAADKRRREEMAAEMQAMQVEQAKQAMEYAAALRNEFSNKSVDQEGRDNIIADYAARYGQFDDLFRAQDRQSEREARKAKAEEQRQKDAMQAYKDYIGMDDPVSARAFYGVAQREVPGFGYPSLPDSAFVRPDKERSRGTMDILTVGWTDQGPKIVGKIDNVPADEAQKMISTGRAIAFREPSGLEDMRPSSSPWDYLNSDLAALQAQFQKPSQSPIPLTPGAGRNSLRPREGEVIDMLTKIPR